MCCFVLERKFCASPWIKYAFGRGTAVNVRKTPMAGDGCRGVLLLLFVRALFHLLVHLQPVLNVHDVFGQVIATVFKNAVIAAAGHG